MEKDLIFICYENSDRKHITQLCIALKAEGVPVKQVVWFDDKNIKPGDNWKQQIQEGIKKSCIAICLISCSFFSSNFIQEVELPLITDAETQGNLKICNVHVSTFKNFEEKSISKFQSVNNPNEPLDLYEGREGEMKRAINMIASDIASEWKQYTRKIKPTEKPSTYSKKNKIKSKDESEITQETLCQNSESRKFNSVDKNTLNSQSYNINNPLPNHIVEDIIRRLRDKGADKIDITEFFSDERQELLKDCVLLAKARYNYQDGKRNAMADCWPKSITKHLFAFTFFSSLNSDYYGYLASRSAGRLAWGLLINSNPIAAKYYLEESKKYDPVQAAGNYFWAIQYALRVNNEEKVRYLTEKYVDICLDLYGEELFDNVKNEKIDDEFAVRFVIKCYSLIKDSNQEKEHLSSNKSEQKKIHSSDIGKLEMLQAQLSLRQKKISEAITSYKAASKTFDKNGLHSYKTLCEIQSILLEYLICKKLRQRKNKLEKLINLYDEFSDSIPARTKINEILKNITKINISFLDALISKNVEQIPIELHSIVKELENCSKRLNADEEIQIVNLRQSIIDIKDLIKELLDVLDGDAIIEENSLIERILISYYELYSLSPYLLERYEPFLIEALKKRLINTAEKSEVVVENM
ncbi:MAG: toll/interleukin-1 receptor domain-containing protein [Sedimentisphaeraceae bacterium JB056]